MIHPVPPGLSAFGGIVAGEMFEPLIDEVAVTTEMSLEVNPGPWSYSGCC